jgi:hypothetical protein
MTSLIPSVPTSSVNQGPPTGSYAASPTIQGLPDELETLLTPKELEAMTAQQTQDVRQWIASPEFQSLLGEEQDNAKG